MRIIRSFSSFWKRTKRCSLVAWEIFEQAGVFEIIPKPAHCTLKPWLVERRNFAVDCLLVVLHNIDVVTVIEVCFCKAWLWNCESLIVPLPTSRNYFFFLFFRNGNHGVLLHWTSIFCRQSFILFRFTEQRSNFVRWPIERVLKINKNEL